MSVTKKLISCVLPGVLETRAIRLWRTSVLINDDLPTLDLPIMAISGSVDSGKCSGLVAPFTNSAMMWMSCAMLSEKRKTPNAEALGVSDRMVCYVMPSLRRRLAHLLQKHLLLARRLELTPPLVCPQPLRLRQPRLLPHQPLALLQPELLLPEPASP